jgi:hypothetical protein
MSVKLEDFATKQELFAYLATNEKRLTAEKRFKPTKKYVDFGTVSDTPTKTATTKADGQPLQVSESEEDSIERTIIGNTFGWCDSQMDVLFSGCATKSIKENGAKGKDLIYHLQDHETCMEDRVGYLGDIYEREFSLTDLGLNMAGTTKCLVFDTSVKKYLNESLYYQYRDGKVKQHSIGLQYVKIFMCINDPNQGEFFTNWNKYFQDVINKDTVLASGYFWAVTEIKLFEVSSVLWGSNGLTNTLEPEQKNSEPAQKATQNISQPTVEVTDVVVTDKIKNLKFF